MGVDLCELCLCLSGGVVGEDFVDLMWCFWGFGLLGFWRFVEIVRTRGYCIVSAYR